MALDTIKILKDSSWRKISRNRIIYIVNEDDVVIAELDNQQTMGFGLDTPEAVNAYSNIISAAPNMLIALKALTDNIDNWLETGMPSDAETSKALYDNAKDAINKAIG